MKVGLNSTRDAPFLFLLFLFLLSPSATESRVERSNPNISGKNPGPAGISVSGLRFGKSDGEFKILQVADMHFADGKKTKCLNVLQAQASTCSDLNTTAFIYRLVRAEKPDLLLFTESIQKQTKPAKRFSTSTYILPHPITRIQQFRFIKFYGSEAGRDKLTIH